MPLHTRHYTSLKELALYSEQWNALVAHSPGNSIFLTWEWVSSWCTYIARDQPLFIIVVFDESEHVKAILPLYQSYFRLCKYISFKWLRFIGDCQCGGEYHDIIISDTNDSESIKNLHDYLFKQKANWDCIYYPYLAGWTGALNRLSPPWITNILFSRQRDTVFSNITLPDSIEQFDLDVIGPLASIVRRQKKKLEQTGRITIELCEQENDLPIYLERLFALHEKRWKSIGQRGSFARRPPMQDFYKGFAPLALARGWLKIFALKRDGIILAIQIGYLYNGVFYQLQEGFDPEGPGGLGNILRHAVICWCIKNKVAEYDYLGGGEQHKLKWGAKQRRGYTLFYGKRSFKNLLLASAEIWPSGRFITSGPPVEYGCSHE